MDFPPIALISGLEKFPGEFRYPAPLMALWRKCTEVKSGPGSNSGCHHLLVALYLQTMLTIIGLLLARRFAATGTTKVGVIFTTR